MPRDDGYYWEGKAEIIKQVKQSYQVRVGGKLIYVPVHLIHKKSPAQKPGDEDLLLIPQWLAVDRQIEDFGEEVDTNTDVRYR